MANKHSRKKRKVGSGIQEVQHYESEVREVREEGQPEAEKGGQHEELEVREEVHTEPEEVHTDASQETTVPVENPRKRHRGPTRMKDIAKDPSRRIHVDFTPLGEPCGPGSVKLSSYLGTLVREHVPMTINNWKKIGEERRTVLWKSVQARFDLDGEYERTSVLKHMGALWRSFKSRVVGKVCKAKNNMMRMKLKPKNVIVDEWRKFVKEKTSKEFQVISEKYKERRQMQIPFTCSRKGMVRLAEDMKNESSEPSKVTRAKVWIKSRTKKDGTAVKKAAEKIRKAAELVDSQGPAATSSNPKEDLLSQVLGLDNPGRLRAMGRGMSMGKLAYFQVKNKYMDEMQENQVTLKTELEKVKGELARMKNQKAEGENSGPRSVKRISQPRCMLYDWCGTDDKVAEGQILSSDPTDFVNDVPLGPNSIKVLVETATKGDAFLWRPAPFMFTIKESVGEIIAWPENFCVSLEQYQPEDIAPKSPTTESMINSCKLLDWTTNNEEVVAVGRFHTEDPKALVNGLPLGPNAVKVFVDKVLQPDKFLWRLTPQLSSLADCCKAFVAWPVRRVVHFGVDTDIDRSASPYVYSAPTPPAPIKKSQAPPKSPSHFPVISQQNTLNKDAKENQKCMLMDITGKKRVVAIGRWFTNDPNATVHCQPLGANAVCVWVDVVKVDDAAIWRTISFMETMEDALGSTLAWPEDKVIVV